MMKTYPKAWIFNLLAVVILAGAQLNVPMKTNGIC
jgi:hypothetical protein